MSAFDEIVQIDGASLYAEFKETSGTLITPTVGPSGYTGLYVLSPQLNQASLLAADPDPSVRLTGSAGQLIEFPNTHYNFGNRAVFSVEIWTRFETIDTNFRRVADKSWFDTSNHGWAIGVHSTSGLFFNRFDAAGVQNQAAWTGVAINTIYHIVAVYDGNNMILYTNGVQRASTPSTINLPTTNTEKLIVGGETLMVGRVQNFVIYDGIALSAAQVLDHYNKGITVDTTGPVQSSISASPTDVTATITWNTDEGAKGQVEWGTTTSYGSSTTLGASYVTSHNHLITGLVPGITYHYRVKSTDISGNTTTSGDFTFTPASNQSPMIVTGSWTVATGADLVPPVVSNIVVTPVSPTSVTVTWSTDEAADTQVEYGLTSAYGTLLTLKDTSPRVTSHSETLTGLTAGTLYNFRVKSKDAAGNLTASANATFTTTTGADTTPPVASEPAAGNILYNQVTITWSTNEPADSQVDYGPTVAYGQSTPYTVAPGTQQSHQLTGLVANTTYHYRIRSRDIAGNESVSTDKTFTTAPAPVATANLTAISPVSTRANREIELIATGTNFTGSNVILLDGVIMPTTFISSTELRATISAANLATPGLKYIEVG